MSLDTVRRMDLWWGGNDSSQREQLGDCCRVQVRDQSFSQSSVGGMILEILKQALCNGLNGSNPKYTGGFYKDKAVIFPCKIVYIILSTFKNDIEK